MALMSLTAAVSFARTPLTEISRKTEEITALGWREVGRGDPWAVSFQKDVSEEQRDPEAELRAVMGEHWLSADAIRSLLASKSQPSQP